MKRWELIVYMIVMLFCGFMLGASHEMRKGTAAIERAYEQGMEVGRIQGETEELKRQIADVKERMRR